jgi:hypothetical protein
MSLFFFAVDRESDGSPTICSWCRTRTRVVTLPLAGTKEAEAAASIALVTLGLCATCLDEMQRALERGTMPPSHLRLVK